MAPLSKQPQDHYGTHLDTNGKTTDNEMEYKNFKFADEALCEVFSNVIIDSYETVAEFINRENSEKEADELFHESEIWISQYVRSTQYMTQIVKCLKTKCCGVHRGNLPKILKSRFLPALSPLSYSPMITTGSIGNEKIQYTTLFQALSLAPSEMPYDKFCPGVMDKIERRSCKKCKIYFASIAMLNNHKKFTNR
jgi:hypothetical protein